MLREELGEGVQHSKTRHLRDIQRNQRYWKGEHYAAPVWQGDRLIWQSARDITSAAKDSSALNDYVLNYVYGEGLNLVGILGRVPNATAVADSEEAVAVEASKKVDRIIRSLWAHWGVEQLQFDLVFCHWLNGTAFAYTPFVVNPQKYGHTVVPQYEMQEQVVDPEHYECFRCQSASSVQEVQSVGSQCPVCGSLLGPESLFAAKTEQMPVQVGEKKFANGSTEIYLFSAMQFTTPYKIKDMENCPWGVLEYEENSSVLMSTYPELADRLSEFHGFQAGTLAADLSGQARDVRAEAASYQRHAQHWSSNDWLYQRAWITPPMYYGLAYKADRNKIRQTVDDLMAVYPDGMKATYVNGRLLRVENERLSEVWSACKPTVGETLYPQPLCTPMIQANDLINDGHNIGVQTAQKGMSLNLYDSSVINSKYFKTQRAAVADWIPATPDVATKLREAVFTTTPAQLQPAVVSMMQTARMASQEIIHITPALTGTDQREKTIGESEMNRNQALLPHNTQWSFIRKFWSDVYTKAAVQFAKHSDGNLYFRVNTALPTAIVKINEIDSILSGGWHVEVDQAIPLTWGQRRAQTFQMFEGGPDMIRLFGMDRPKNLKTIYEILGNEDFEVPGMAEYNKVMADIRELLTQEPIPGPMGEFMPSIPPEEMEMDHSLWVQYCKEWFYTDEARENKQNNQPGYLNVLARFKAELEIVNMLAAANAPLPEAPEGGGSSGGSGGPTTGSNSVSSPPPMGADVVGPAEPPQPRPEEMAAASLEGR